MNGELNVLLLDDSRFDAELLRENLALTHPGALVTVVAGERAFKEALAARRYDVILSDYMIPGYGGADALDHAREAAPYTPFIFVSGVIGEDNAVEMLKRGATDYVSKSRLTRLPVVLERALREVAQREAADRAVEALRAARDEAERANQAKDRFLAVLSHELRTPLTPIAAAAQVLQESATVPESHSHLLPMIRRNIALEARLIEDLLDLTAIAAGKVSLKIEAVDMHRLIGVVIDMVSQDIQAHDLQVEARLDAAQFCVTGDEARMHQVVWNILRNAIKFTPPKGTIQLRTSSADGWFTMACTDSGIGIEAGALPRIFTPFEQADTEVSRQFGGLGLGLAIARGLVLDQGGELTASSDGRGKGATFALSLKVAADAAAADAAPAPASPPRDSQPDAAVDGAPACRMLLVEDNPDSADILAMGMEAYGYQVTLAGSCAQALDKAASQTFDVVVTDLGLPDGSGIEIGRALSGRLPVIALSGYGTAQDVKRSTSAGFAGHLVKPASLAAVHAMVQKVLAARCEPAPAA
ncbi:MAG: response regulator [Comamonadaceae bacterium]|nr:MAG: response regulator [Comamonadaceae bacterium]